MVADISMGVVCDGRTTVVTCVQPDGGSKKRSGNSALVTRVIIRYPSMEALPGREGASIKVY